MRTNKKAFIFFSAISIAIIMVVYLIWYIIILGSYKDLEEKEIYEETQLVLNILSKELIYLNKLNRDYAAWDDTYEFIKEKNTNYIEKNLMNITFLDCEWNVFILIDTQGNIVYQKGVDLINNREVPVSSNLIKELNGQPSLFRFSQPTSSIAGIVTLPEGNMMISAHPVVTGYLKGPIRGSLVIGKYIDNDKISQLAEQSRLSILLEEFNEQHMLKKPQSLYETYIGKHPIWVENTVDNHISGYSLLYDIYGKPAFMLRINKARDIYLQGCSSMVYFAGSTLGVYFIFFIAICFFMNKIIFTRLQILMSSIKQIRKNKDLSTRILVSSKDEFSMMESEFNNMLVALEESQKKIIHQANHDILTGVSNRCYFYNQVKQLLKQHYNCNEIAAVMFIDLDNFKTINDSHGHQTGDFLLQAFTEILENNVVKGSIISRLGGDEFIIFLPNIKEVKMVEKAAQGIIHSINHPFFIDDKPLFITASIGISLYPFDGTDIDTLINNADFAMYHVKENAKNNFKFYGDEIRN